MATISFKPKHVTKRMLSNLQDRAHDVIVNRFGLTDEAERKTLEAIGEKYGITRERVRQIENAALTAIKKAETFKAEKSVFNELKELVSALGGIVPEADFLSHISKDALTQNHIHLYLVLGDEFKKSKEDEHFKARWSIDDSVTESVHDAIHELYKGLDDDELVSESEIINRFFGSIKGVSDVYKEEEIAKRWLALSKAISKNPLGEWGKASSSNVKTRGVKDYAFLVMRKHGSPMHFREVAAAIEKTFGKKTHVPTCHNELIKDPRFVLVGRGYYALADWGYKPGVVREVIREIIKKEGPLSKEAIIEKVSKERFLKHNTILVNLQNAKYFKKNKNGLYTVA